MADSVLQQGQGFPQKFSWDELTTDRLSGEKTCGLNNMCEEITECSVVLLHIHCVLSGEELEKLAVWEAKG